MLDSGRSDSERGSILLFVLLLLALLSAIALSVSLNTRSTNVLQSNYVDQVRARQLARSGLVLAKAEFLNRGKFSPDYGTIHTLDNGTISINASDEEAKMGLNSASKELLKTFATLIEAEERADIIASAIVDYRDANETTLSGENENNAYQGAGFGEKLKNRWFEEPDELCQIMSRTTCEYFISHVTVWNSKSGFDVEVASKYFDSSEYLKKGHQVTDLSRFQIPSSESKYSIKILSETKGGSKSVSQIYFIPASSAG